MRGPTELRSLFTRSSASKLERGAATLVCKLSPSQGHISYWLCWNFTSWQPHPMRDFEVSGCISLSFLHTRTRTGLCTTKNFEAATSVHRLKFIPWNLTVSRVAGHDLQSYWMMILDWINMSRASILLIVSFLPTQEQLSLANDNFEVFAPLFNLEVDGLVKCLGLGSAYG